MISTPEQITSHWLAAVLERSGIDGNLARFDVAPHTSGKPNIFYLNLAYQHSTRAPKKLVLKLLKTAKPYHFYTAMAAEMESPPLIPVYAADYDFGAGRGYLLMADLSDSHYQTEPPIPPSLEDCRAAVDLLARIHAHWWAHPRLESDLAGWVLERRWQTRLLEAAAQVEDFLAFLGDRLSVSRKQIYRQVGRSWPRLVEARQGKRPLTVTHGDAHAWNFLFPHDKQTGQAVLFDWTNLDISTATDDLAYLIGLHWYPARRAAYEKPLLQEYHRRLAAYGVREYPWEECWEDYRRSILRAMLIPVWQRQVGISPAIWWPHLERGLCAYEDLSCAGLLP